MIEIILKALNDNSGVLNLIFSLIVALSTAFYVILTRRLANETRAMRKLQVSPHVAITIESYEGYLGFLKFVVQNIGAGPAFDVRLSTEPDFEMERGKRLSQIGVFAHGIRYMAPNQKVEFFFTTLLGKTDEVILNDPSLRFVVTATYRSVLNNTITQKYPIDFLHFIGISSLGTPSMQTIAKEITKISDTLGKFESGFSHAHVDIYDYADRLRAIKEREAQRNQLIAQQSIQTTAASISTKALQHKAKGKKRRLTRRSS